MGSGTTVQEYVGACRFESWSFAWDVYVLVNEMKDLERLRGECCEPNREGRREKVEGSGGLRGGGEPGSTPATQAEIAVTVLDRRREILRTDGVGGRGSEG